MEFFSVIPLESLPIMHIFASPNCASRLTELCEPVTDLTHCKKQRKGLVRHRRCISRSATLFLPGYERRAARTEVELEVR